ncbi:MAG: DUF932 domain-containing protein [Candidatus Thalassarchaeaceae archaeon]
MNMIRASAATLTDPDYSALDFPVERRPIYGRRLDAFGNEIFTEIPDKFENVRLDTSKSMGVVGKRYHVTPYINHARNIVEAFNESRNDVNLDGATTHFEVFEGGRKMQAKIILPNETIEPAIGDVSRCEFLDFDSYDASWARKLNYRQFRYWCSNGCDHQDFKINFYQKHTVGHSSDEAIAKLKDRIVKSIQAFHNNEAMFKSWINTPIEFDDAMGIYKNTIAAYRDNKGRKRHSEAMIKELDPILHHNSQTLGMNGWAVYNAATEWATHLGDNFKGAAHNVRRNRSTKIAKMLRTDTWKSYFGDDHE